MATKIIKAWINGAVQEIEVEDIVSPELEPTVEERVEDLEEGEISTDSRLNTLEDKHNTVITAGNFLVGNGTTELEEMTPEETLSHINGSSIAMVTTEEYEAIASDGFNANTFYLVSDGEENENYYDKTEIDGMVENINTSITDAINEAKSYSDSNLENAEIYTDNAVSQKSQVQLINVNETENITEILPTLKIHKLSKEKYEEELANGNIDEDALYLTPDEEIDLSSYATVEQLNNKADAQHVHEIADITNLQSTLDNNLAESKGYTDTKTSNYYTKSEIDNMTFITVEDIDAICASIV